ncbi:serine/threonine-protein kinase [Glycomyces tritici]|uniref:non-specific serine/threonine protein kinase n=1 Tax=Glycomyces tritici TaxID=2665176 RepID=A0ABT7YHP4_9ACTN|nr:serine/threonine-protein kinase [Glycomyces tritici]MDN3238141.1 serine/threonine-protein kinase [Glycomyces tritici]
MRAGQVVGDRYRLEERLGSGSQGQVWRAADLRLRERSVALKRALTGGDAAAAARVRREAEVLASVNHPNVVTVYDAVEEDGDWWIVMEYVDGRTLADTGTMGAEQAARYGAQLAGGLEAVHAKGILHRDIKPANVMVTAQGHAKLADFGIARQVHTEPTLTGTGAVTGTPGYVAPEVVRGASFSPAADVFSLGATIFHLVEGTSPFGEGNAHSLLWRTAQGDRVEPKRAGALAPLLDRLLETDPKRRIKVGEARVALGKLGGEAAIGAAKRPRRSWVWAGAAATALVVLTAAVWNGMRDNGSEAAQEDPPELDPWDFVGDQITADPCSLWDEAALGAYGPTEIDADNGPFESCDLRIENDTGGVDLNLYFYETNGKPHQQGDVSMVGEFGLISDEGSHDRCTRTLIFPDGEHFVEMYAKQDPGEDTEICPIIDTAANAAIAVVAEGRPLPRREREEDPESLFHLDACELLDDEALERFPGVAADDPLEGFGGWTCAWTSTTSETVVRVLFDRDDPPEADDGQRLQYAGMVAYNEGDHWSEDDSCLVSVVYRQFTSAEGDGTITAEYLRIWVIGDDPVEELCDLAEAMAGPAAEALPDA